MLPLSWAEPDFMRRALLAVLLVCPTCAMLGVLVVNRQMTFFSEAISHSAFTGIAIGLLLGMGNPVPAMVGFCLLIGLGVAMVRSRSSLALDSVIGVFFAVSISLGLVIISALQGLARQLPLFLFGDILTVSAGEIVGMALVCAACFAFLWFAFNPLLIYYVSPEVAITRGLRTSLFEYGFAVVLSLVVALSIRVVGMLLITAMLVVPAAAARNIASSAGAHFRISVVIGAVSGVFGLVASYYFNTATGASIILISSVLFFITLAARAIFVR